MSDSNVELINIIKDYEQQIAALEADNALLMRVYRAAWALRNAETLEAAEPWENFHAALEEADKKFENPGELARKMMRGDKSDG